MVGKFKMEVTDSYKEAIAAVTRSERITGYIKFKDTGEKLQITDENIVGGSLSLDEQICSGSFKIGTFNTAQLKLAIYDSDAQEHDFTNAVVNLNYGLLLSGGAYYYIPLGKYNVDGGLLKRRRDRVYMTAFDNSVHFDKNKPSADWISETGIYKALRRLCSASGVGLAATEEEINELPNSGMMVALTDPQLQTNRDCVMWLAALMGCYAKINRSGKLEIKKAVYKWNKETAEIFPEWVITGDERISTVFSDTRTFAKHMTGYSAGKVKRYSSNVNSSDEQAVEGVLALAQNPIIKKLSEMEADKVNQNICNEVSRFLQRGVETDIFGNPALECGETIRLSGGVLDIGRRIIGLVTRRTWRYRRSDRLICQIHDVWVPVDDEDEEGASTNSGSGENTETGNYVYVTPKSQTEKRIDALCETISELSELKEDDPIYFFGKTQNGYKVNGIEYSWVRNSGGFVEQVTDSGGNVFYPNLSDTGTTAEEFNGLLLPVLLARGIESNEKPAGDFVTRWNLNRGSGGTTLTIPSQSGEFNCTADWGDGIITQHTSGNLVHTYAEIPSDGMVTVSITGQYNGICIGNTGATGMSYRLSEIVSWGNVGFTSMKNAFWGCVYLTRLPNTPITGAENAADFSFAFYKISARSYEVGESAHVPDYFFINCKSAENFYAVFYNDIMISMTFGKGLFKGCSKATNFAIAFSGAADMTVDNEMFEGCTSAQNCTRIFGGDAAGYLDIGDRVFADCVNITTMENVMGYYHSYNISPTWFNLESMRNRSINFNIAFHNNSGSLQITGTAPDLWNYISSSSNVTRGFQNCTSLTNYGEIPSAWK